MAFEKFKLRKESNWSQRKKDKSKSQWRKKQRAWKEARKA